MTRRCQSVAAHSAVVFCFVACLSERGEPYNHVSGLYVRIVYYVFTPHAACYGAVYDYGPDEVAYVGCLPSCADYVHAMTP